MALSMHALALSAHGACGIGSPSGAQVLLPALCRVV